MTRTLALLLLLGAGPAAAQSTDDSDLSAHRATPAAAKKLEREGRTVKRVLIFPLSPIASATNLEGDPGTASGSLLLADHEGRLHPARLATASLVGPDDRTLATAAVADDGTWALALPKDAKGAYRVRFSLDHARWSFRHPDRGTSYAWESAAFQLPSAEPVRLGALSPEAGSENAKVGVIHLTFLSALDTLARNGIGLGWWKETLAVNWPDDADYFSSWGFSLHLTTPHAWDVNLHELGHAVMHASMRAASAGGQHKIDECYSAALAWSEGWATFFAGVVHLDPSDSDARFEYLVPRRAPIRIENVPDDVCRGQNSEWRVAAALWDLYDAHAEAADACTLPFARLWNAWAGKSMTSLTDYVALLAPALSPSELSSAQAALRQNTILLPSAPGPLGANGPLTFPSFE